jgi:nitroimidazol reductase NimA-like FMN-containing flavoprotein (pyridoxamine 5'-phosphate oxidase superfamily)
MVTGNAQRHSDLKDTIRRVLDRNHLAVLATQHRGQPHASLMAFTPIEGVRYIIFATYRGTLKHQSLVEDGRAAVLVDGGGGDTARTHGRMVVTAIGEATEIPEEERAAHIAAHLARHPDLREFLRSPDCVLMRVSVAAYQVVGGIDDVQWYHMDAHAAA